MRPSVKSVSYVRFNCKTKNGAKMGGKSAIKWVFMANVVHFNHFLRTPHSCPWTALHLQLGLGEWVWVTLFLVHNFTIFGSYLDVGNIDDQCRGPSVKEKDQRERETRGIKETRKTWLTFKQFLKDSFQNLLHCLTSPLFQGSKVSERKAHYQKDTMGAGKECLNLINILTSKWRTHLEWIWSVQLFSVI